MADFPLSGLGSVVPSVGGIYLEPGAVDAPRCWYAVYTLPQNEKSVSAHLGVREIESYLPTYQTVRRWKNRQQVRLVLPLFPSYLFVRIARRERVRVFGCPGVVRMVGNSSGPIPVPDATIDFLRSDLCSGRAEPYRELVVGERVRIKDGAMRGVEGTLTRKNDKLRFILSVDMIQRCVAVEIDACYLEPVLRPQTI
jgi:transcription antitermination factor NusG